MPGVPRSLLARQGSRGFVRDTLADALPALHAWRAARERVWRQDDCNERRP